MAIHVLNAFVCVCVHVCAYFRLCVSKCERIVVLIVFRRFPPFPVVAFFFLYISFSHSPSFFLSLLCFLIFHFLNIFSNHTYSHFLFSHSNFLFYVFFFTDSKACSYFSFVFFSLFCFHCLFSSHI